MEIFSTEGLSKSSGPQEEHEQTTRAHNKQCRKRAPQPLYSSSTRFERANNWSIHSSRHVHHPTRTRRVNVDRYRETMTDFCPKTAESMYIASFVMKSCRFGAQLEAGAADASVDSVLRKPKTGPNITGHHVQFPRVEAEAPAKTTRRQYLIPVVMFCDMKLHAARSHNQRIGDMHVPVASGYSMRAQERAKMLSLTTHSQVAVQRVVFTSRA